MIRVSQAAAIPFRRRRVTGCPGTGRSGTRAGVVVGIPSPRSWGLPMVRQRHAVRRRADRARLYAPRAGRAQPQSPVRHPLLSRPAHPSLPRHNAYMADVPLSVALISPAAAIIGAAVSQLMLTFREGRQANRDRQERDMTARRQACLDLLSAVGQLRAQVAGNYEYHGLEMAGRLAEVRQRAVEAELAAIAVSLCRPVRWPARRRILPMRSVGSPRPRRPTPISATVRCSAGGRRIRPRRGRDGVPAHGHAGGHQLAAADGEPPSAGHQAG